MRGISAGKSRNKPQFFGWQAIRLLTAIFNLIEAFRLIKKKARPVKAPGSGYFRDTLAIRKKLHLTKIVRFNRQFYSNPIVPAFPSDAFDNYLINGGLNYNYLGTKYKEHTDSAFIAVTNRCSLNCRHCYEKHNIGPVDKISYEKLQETIRVLQANGVSIIILTGGEPMMRFDTVIDLLKSGDKSKSDFHLHTSGMGVTRERVRQLKQAGLKAAAVGLDYYNELTHDTLRSRNSFKQASEALRLFNEEGIFTYVNICATRDLTEKDGIWEYYELVKYLNVGMIQLLEPRPCGGLANKNTDNLLTPQDQAKLYDFFITANSLPKYRDYPLVYYTAFMEGRNGMGCTMGGLSHLYIDSMGNVNPCVFMPVSFGNIVDEEINQILIKMRHEVPYPILGECPAKRMPEFIELSGNGKIPVRFENIKDEWRKMFIKAKKEKFTT